MELQSKDRRWILIVDDEPDIRSTMKEIIDLSMGGSVRVIEAENGAEATSKINCQIFDCIITDLAMPKKEGKAFITSVRHNMYNESTPVIILSGNDEQKDEILESFDFVYFMPKPCNFQEMSQLLKAQLDLGSTENRISADAMNEIVKTTKAFISSFTGDEEVHQTSIETKKKGEDLSRMERVSTIQVSAGPVKNYFSLILNQEDIEGIKKIRPEYAEKRDKEIVDSLSFVILNHVIKSLNKAYLGRFEINKLSLSAEQVRKKSGLKTTIGNEKLEFGIFASTTK